MADKAGIETVNGDKPQGQEFLDLTEACKEEAIVYYGTERFMLPYVFGEYEGDFQELYKSKFIFNFIEYYKVSLTIGEQ